MIRASRGSMDIGVTGAILLIIVASLIVERLGWWDAWPWWGNTLYVFGCLIVLGVGANFEDSRGWKKDYAIPENPEPVEKKEGSDRPRA